MTDIKSNNIFIKGIVVDTNDPNSESKIKVRIPCYHGISGDENSIDDSKLPWAQTCLQNSNAFNVGDTVWITFEGGDKRYPVIFGQLGSTASFSDGTGTVNGATTGSIGIVGGSHDITIDGQTYHVEGSTLAEIGVSLIKIHESGNSAYQAINGYDVNGPSIGLIQWHNENAIALLKKIRDRNTSQYDKIAKDNGADSLISDLTSGTDWYGESLTSGSSRHTAVKEILGTKESAEVQDEMAAEFVQTYIDLGLDAGISDNGALLYHADICNQGPYMNVCINMRKSSDKSLENFYNMSKNDWYERRTLTYKIIKELQNLGALNGTGGVIEVPANRDGASLIEIAEDVMSAFRTKYNDPSTLWEYSTTKIRDYSIRGKSIKVRTDSSGFISAILMVLAQETGDSYAKEVDNWNASLFMSSKITGFDKIAYKYSDLKDGDIVVTDGYIEIVNIKDGKIYVYNCKNNDFITKDYPESWWENTSDDAYKYIFRIKQLAVEWTWPVPSCLSVSSSYGNRTWDDGSTEFHKGIDIPGAGGSTIVSSTSGTVVTASCDGRAYSENGGYICGGSGYGNCTVIYNTDKQYYVLYGHQNSINVEVGQQVTAGQVIGTVGNTGMSFGNHLHFEVRTADGTLCDPMKFVSYNGTGG